MMLKYNDGEYQVFDLNGLNLIICSSKIEGKTEVYINYPHYHYWMFYCGFNYEDFDIEDIEFNIEQDFAYIMKNYFTQLEKLEEKI